VVFVDSLYVAVVFLESTIMVRNLGVCSELDFKTHITMRSFLKPSLGCGFVNAKILQSTF